MSLREQLRDILPQILPSDPAEAIKGTELIRLVRYRLGEEYSDATLRYHFSILSYDPSSPIAKVDQGQGYYFRTGKPEDRPEPSRTLFNNSAGEDLDLSRLSRFSCIVERHSLLNSRYPFIIPQDHDLGWELPHLMISDWDFESDPDEAPRLDEPLMNLKRHLGVPIVSLTAVHLQVSVSLETCQADFFQTLSTTRWANQGELFIAGKVNDSALVDTLRVLGHQYGVGVSSFGLDMELLDELPEPEDIRRMSTGEFESLQTFLKIQRIATSTPRPHLDWQHLSALKKKHEGIKQVVTWLNECLDNGKPVWLGKSF